MSQDKMVCYCSSITEEQIVKAIEEGARTLEDIRKVTGACTIGNCKELSPLKKCCSSEIISILRDKNTN